MNMKPHCHKGRFYNSPTDSICTRLKHMFTTILLIARYRLTKQGRKQGILGAHDVVQRWSVKPELMHHSEELKITWLGHATFLIQVDGFNILTDPVFFEIAPLAAGRLVPTPVLPQHLPAIDAVLISHNHRDHLDDASIKKLKHHQPHMCVPLGNKKWLARRGFKHVTEATWWDDIVLQRGDKTLKLSFLPASHWTGRGIFDSNKTLWGSWMIQSLQQTIYFAGDTAYDQHFEVIAQKYPKIDIALMPVGPNEPRMLMHDAHISAEEPVEAFITLRARHFIPMHWGTFMFGFDSFLLPIERLEMGWKTRHKDLVAKQLHIVKFGQTIQLASGVQQQPMPTEHIVQSDREVVV